LQKIMLSPMKLSGVLSAPPGSSRKQDKSIVLLSV
jgi:hypothetical protein